MKHMLITGIGTDEDGIRVFIGESGGRTAVTDKLLWYTNNLHDLDLRIVMETEDDHLQTTTSD